MDLSFFDTSSVTTMYEMFSGCIGLSNLNLSSFDTSQVKHFDYMFYSMSNLEHLNIQNFDTSNAENFHKMFEGTLTLTTIVYGDNFVYANQAEYGDMFHSCSANKPVHPSWNGKI